MTPGPTNSRTGETTTTPQRKAHAISFSHTMSADDGDLVDEEWADPTPILPTTPLDGTPPLFPSMTASSVEAGAPPMMAKTKSSSSTKSRKQKEARAPVPFPSCQAEGADDRSRCVPQMSTARGREGCDCAGGLNLKLGQSQSRT